MFIVTKKWQQPNLESGLRAKPYGQELITGVNNYKDVALVLTIIDKCQWSNLE